MRDQVQEMRDQAARTASERRVAVQELLSEMNSRDRKIQEQQQALQAAHNKLLRLEYEAELAAADSIRVRELAAERDTLREKLVSWGSRSPS